MTRAWRERWEKSIIDGARSRYCDKEMGEEIGWLVSPFLSGFYHGYQATGETQWIERLIDWTDAWTGRAVNDPDGYPGWPKEEGASTAAVASLYTDNLLGEAMGLHPALLMAHALRRDDALWRRYGPKLQGYVALAERVFEKWERRGCWRAVSAGGLWVVPEFGVDRKTGKWTDGYARRATEGFSMPANKQNVVAQCLVALAQATGKARYRDRARAWWRVMKSRIRLRESGKYVVWNYWDPAGPWDYKPDGTPRHWVGVHPNGGYYGIDVAAIVAACEQRLVFTRQDRERLIATNRDFMWNGNVEGAAFQRIDGVAPDERWKNTPGVLWSALIPYDSTLRRIFEANHDPAGWGGLASTPWFLALQKSHATGSAQSR